MSSLIWFDPLRSNEVLATTFVNVLPGELISIFLLFPICCYLVRSSKSCPLESFNVSPRLILDQVKCCPCVVKSGSIKLHVATPVYVAVLQDLTWYENNCRIDTLTCASEARSPKGNSFSCFGQLGDQGYPKFFLEHCFLAFNAATVICLSMDSSSSLVFSSLLISLELGVFGILGLYCGLPTFCEAISDIVLLVVCWRCWGLLTDG